MSFISKVEAASGSRDHTIIKGLGTVVFDLYQRLRKEPIEKKNKEKLKQIVDNLAILPEILTGEPSTSANIKKIQELLN